MNIGLYCNWGIIEYNNDFYIKAIHKNYIEAFKEHSDKLYILSKVKKTNLIKEYVKIDISNVYIIGIPWFNGYIQSIKYFFNILFSIYNLYKKSDFIYIRVPEPFCWFFAFLNFFKNKKIHYHYVSFPIEVINSYTGIKKILKKILYYPEYYLTAIAAFFNKSSCLGEKGRKKLPLILSKKIVPLYESSYRKNDIPLKKYSYISKENIIKFLYVGRITDGKGIDELIKSIYLFSKNTSYNFSFSIVGEGNLVEKMLKDIEKYKINNIVKYMGYIDFGYELKKIYSMHDVIVLPSYSEGCSRVLLEGALNSLFVVSTDVGCARDIFCNGNSCNCILTKVGSVEDLVDAYQYIFENKNLVNDKANNGAFIAKQITLDDFVNKILNINKVKLNNE